MVRAAASMLAGHGGRAGGVFGGAGERVGVHGGAVKPGEGVIVGGGRGVGGGLGAVAVQDRGEDVDGGRRVCGFGPQDAVRVGFGGAEVDVVFGLAVGERDVELLAGEPIGADDVARAVDVAAAGGDALGAVDGAGIPQRGVCGDIVGRRTVLFVARPRNGETVMDPSLWLLRACGQLNGAHRRTHHRPRPASPDPHPPRPAKP